MCGGVPCLCDRADRARFGPPWPFRQAAEPGLERSVQIEECLAALELAHSVTGVSGALTQGCLSRAEAERCDFPGKEQEAECLRHSDAYVWLARSYPDTYAAALFGLAVCFDLVATEEQKPRIRALVRAILDRLLEEDLVLCDGDGTPIPDCSMKPGNIPMKRRALGLQALQLLRIGYHLSGDARYLDKYRELAVSHEYSKRGVQLNIQGDWWSRDDLRAFEAYYHLLQYEDDPA